MSSYKTLLFIVYDYVLKIIIERDINTNYIPMGWLDDLSYIDKTFDETMAKRGFANTNIRNQQTK